VATAARPETKLVGLLAFVVGCLGALYLLLLPRLRVLVLVPVLIATVPWFFASRGTGPPGVSIALVWPVLFMGAATVAYAAWVAVRRRVISRGEEPAGP
jgi:hypothetical protein